MPRTINVEYDGIRIPRRDFLIAATAIISGTLARDQPALSAEIPWYTQVRRCGHSNFVETDPLHLNVEEWIDYWTSLKVDSLTLSAGGMVAFYPTGIPFHHRSPYLGKRDLFGEFTHAAKKRGIRVMARLDPKSNFGDAIRQHPEWFMRSADGGFSIRDERGKKNDPVNDEWIYWTCMFTDYFTNFIPEVMREVNSKYDIDGFVVASWPTMTPPKACYCAACKRIGDPKKPEYLAAVTKRTVEVIRLWDSVAREKSPDNLYIVNFNGWLAATQNLQPIAAEARWLYADHQGRPDHQGEGDLPVWHYAQQARVLHAVCKNKPVSLNPAENSHTRLLWRETSSSAAEIEIGLAQATASGSVPYYTWLGGAPEDNRWREPGRKFYQWHARHDQHFVNTRSIANLGVLWSQSTNAQYRPPKEIRVTDYMQGMYYALLEGRFAFDLVHEENLDPANLRKYSALVLPNVAVLSDSQATQLRSYVEAGGSLLATFETGLFDGTGAARNEFALADVLGIQKAGHREGAMGSNLHCYYGHIERDHEILRGFEGTRVLPGAEYRIPVRAISTNPVLTVIPPYPGHPPEFVFPATPHTNEPAIVLGEKDRSRLVYFPGDVDRSCWRSGDTDISLLIQNSIRWMLRNQMPVSVTGEGMAEIFAWETQPGFAVHVVNYNNPNMTYGWLRRHYAIGPQTVRLQVPEGMHVSKAELLRAEVPLPVTQKGSTVEFVIPRVEDYEVAALYAG